MTNKEIQYTLQGYEIRASQEDFEFLDGVIDAPLAELNQMDLIASLQNGGHGMSPPTIDVGLLGQQEETMDAVIKYGDAQEWFPVSPRGPPARTNFSGHYNFAVEVKSQDMHKKKYLYSHRLNRIYVDMEKNFSVQFRWDFAALAGQNAYVRACTVFADAEQAEKRVECCLQHVQSYGNESNKAIGCNVLHSDRNVGDPGVYYCGIPSLPDSWYSVVVFLPPGDSARAHAFKFRCKNSCSTGINRRAIDIIFTLENKRGEVLGRHTVGARVCACPRRDMHRDEEQECSTGAKRPIKKPAEAYKSKKIKIEVVNEEDIVTLPPLQVVGVEAVVTGFEVMISMMEQAARFKENDQQAVESYKNSISSLKNKINELKNGDRPPPAQ